ncbi:MAG: asparagine synthase (glutamine-hydrolyzing) [Balneola sp.]
MCGIFGIVKKEGHLLDDKKIYKMHKAQLHRGPDHFGYLKDGKVFLGNNRLSIIDLEQGNQPFYSSDRKIAVLQNGEIFNFVELQNELRGKGIKFDTSSDTEVILKLYEEYGIEMLNKLNGMFSISILDKKKQCLYLVRDRFGVKPLFYYKDSTEILFSSEIKSLLEVLKESSINKKALISYLKYNFVGGNESIFNNINSVKPGHYLKLNLKNNDLNEIDWWDQEKEIVKYQELLSLNSDIDLVREIIFDSIKIRMRSDVEYSAFLSGGIDSSIIVSQMNKITDTRFNTFTIGFNNSKYDESKFADEVAKELNVNHHCELINNDILEVWKDVLFYTEQPHGDASFMPMYLLSKLASKKDKVVLTGDGADEIFGGYDKYFHFNDEKNFLDDFTSESTLFKNSDIEQLGDFPNVKDVDIIRDLVNVDPLFNSGVLRDAPNMAMYLDVKFLLPNNNLIKPDRMGMAHSIELRSPFMDYRVVSLGLALRAEEKLKNKTSKYYLREAFKNDIPDLVSNRKKQKFIVPLNENKLNIEKFFKIIKNSKLSEIGITNDKFIENLYFNHLNNKSNNYRELRALAALSLWHDNFSKYI